MPRWRTRTRFTIRSSSRSRRFGPLILNRPYNPFPANFALPAPSQKHAQTKGDLDELVELYEAAQKDVELKKSQVKELSALAADLEGQRRTDGSLKRRLTEEREELASKLRKVEDEKAREASSWKRELEDSEAHWRRQLQDKDSVGPLSTLCHKSQSALIY